MDRNRGSGKIEIRHAKDGEDFEMMVESATAVFGGGGITRDNFYSVSRYSPGYRYGDTLLCIVDGEAAGALNVLRRKICVRGALVKAGCVADVHVRKEYRGRGLGLRLLKSAVDYMKSERMTVSLLFSEKSGFYEKLGWRPVYRHRYVLDSSRGDFLVPARYGVERSETADALRALRGMCEISPEYHGQVHRDRNYWKSLEKWIYVRNPVCCTALEKGRVAAVCLFAERAGKLWMLECRNLPGHDESPKNLLREALREAKSRGLESVVSPFPETHPVSVKTILLGGRREIETELMGLVLDPMALMEAVAPHVFRSTGKGEIKKQRYSLNPAGYGTIEIVSSERGIKIRGPAGIKGGIEMDDEEFLNVMLGAAGLGSGATGDGFPANTFKPREYAFWQLDKF